MKDSIDLSVGPKRIHILAIGGAGMSGIAQIFHSLGHIVSGTDAKASLTTQRLADLGINVRIGHNNEIDSSVELVGYSTAIKPDNPELVAWKAAGVPTHHRFGLLKAIGETSKTLSISGTHGKTTTSSMVQAILDASGWDPNYLIGSNLAGKETGTHWSGSDWFVLEADESDATFLAPPRAGAIITNVEPDHLDFYGSMENLEKAFVEFAEQTDGPVVVCGDDPGSASLAKSLNRSVLTYGDSGAFDYRISSVVMDRAGSSWNLDFNGQSSPLSLSIQTAGIHLVRNATAAAALATEIGVGPDAVVSGLAGWLGTGRRFEPRGSILGVEFRDDYAHLPTEVAAVLSTAEALTPNRLVAVFQPHRYTRTAEVGSTFGPAFTAADVVVVTDIFAAGETPIAGVDSEMVAGSIRRDAPDVEVILVSGRDALISTLVDVLKPGDLCLTLGAGDITTLPTDVIGALESAGGEAVRGEEL